MSYINIQGIKEFYSCNNKYLKEPLEDNVFDEYAAQLIAHNMSEASKEKKCHFRFSRKWFRPI